MAGDGPSSSPLSSPPASSRGEISPVKKAIDTLQLAEPDSPMPSQPEKKAKLTHGDDAAEDASQEAIQDSITIQLDGRQSNVPAKRRSPPKERKSSGSKPKRRVVSGPKKSLKERKWETPFVFTDPKSPLANADLRVSSFLSRTLRQDDVNNILQAILLLPGAWGVLTEEEKKSILAKFPDDSHIIGAGTADARPNVQSLRNDDNFRHDCARYCENIEQGRHDDEWLNQAWVAHEMHRVGEFDDYLRQKFEEDWDTKLPDDSGSKEPEKGEEMMISLDVRQPPTNNSNTGAVIDEKGPQPEDPPEEKEAITATDPSPTAERRLKTLTLKTTSPVSDTESVADQSPTGLKRKRDQAGIDKDQAGGGRKVSGISPVSSGHQAESECSISTASSVDLMVSDSVTGTLNVVTGDSTPT